MTPNSPSKYQIRLISILSAAIWFIAYMVPVGAVVISAQTSGTATRDQAYLGQEVVIGDGTSWKELTFAWDIAPGDAFEPYAASSLFLLSKNYVDNYVDPSPSALSVNTIGYIAHTTNITNMVWQFASDVTIYANETYYFFMGNSTNVNNSGQEVAFDSTESGWCRTNFQNQNYTCPSQNQVSGGLDYRLTGTVVSSATAPAPGMILIFGTGLAAFYFQRRLRRKLGMIRLI